jgi:filamentous hemagglutinin family protein
MDISDCTADSVGRCVLQEPSVAVQKRQAFVIRLVVAGCLAAVTPRAALPQHITIDGRFSPAQPLTGPNYAISAGLGKQVGSNLFHSFGQFGLATGESATFSGPATISNMIGRVTGGSQSSIDGRIQSNITGANLYLINPSGIVFGPNATINISGSFHASTADYLKMSDGTLFQATKPDGSTAPANTIKAAYPVAFGFLNASPAKISVNGSNLGVPSGQTLGLVGGPVWIRAAAPSAPTGAMLTAPTGTIHVTSAAGTGEVPVDPRNTSALTVTSFGPVAIKGNSNGGSTLDVSNLNVPGNGGSVFIRSGALRISASGEINADNYGSGAGGTLFLRGDSQVTLSNNANVHAVAFGSGGGAGVTISAGELAILNGGRIDASTFGIGVGGSITVSVARDLLIDGNKPFNPNFIFARTGLFAEADGAFPSGGQRSGNGGRITVTAEDITISNGGKISTSALGSGEAGAISITATGNLQIAGLPSLQPSSNSNTPTGILSSGSEDSPSQFIVVGGAAGEITVRASNLAMSSGGQISTVTKGSRGGGDINVFVSKDANLSGGTGDASSGITASAQSGSSGQAGEVALMAGSLSITNGGGISSRAVGAKNGLPASTGNAGTVTVDVTGPLSIDGKGSVITTSTDPGTSGNAGSMTVLAGKILITSGAAISSTTAGSGTGGSVNVTSPGTLALAGGAQIAASATGTQSGPGGSVAVYANSLIVEGGAQIAGITAGPGNGGSVQVTAQGPLSLSDPESGILASATLTASGNAGSVAVNAPQITLTRGAEIASTTAGTGAGGSVGVTTPGALVLDGLGNPNTQIAASATGLQSGAGGAVTVQANSLSVAGGAQIASSTAGAGAGGDVDVTVANGISLSGTGPASAGAIIASAVLGSSGPAGQVMLTAGGAIAISGGARVASSTSGRGNAGTVQVSSRGPLSLTDPVTAITAEASPTASGNAGSVSVNAPQISLTNGAQISSTTAGTGAGGLVTVTTPGALMLIGGSVGNTEIAASATGLKSGPGGAVTVMADTVAVENGARIASTTFGSGRAGDIAVTAANGVTLAGQGLTGTSGITASAQQGSSGQAGEVSLIAGGAIALSAGAKVTSSTAGAGNGGTVEVTAGGPLSLSDPGSGIIASATSTASGNAGSVSVGAPQIALMSGAEGTGAGGSVMVTTPGMLVLDGAGVSGTQIAASATGPQSGPGGSVTVAANSLTVEGGAQIASSTAGPGKGGDAAVTVANGVTLSGVGPSGASAVTASAQPGSSGQAGEAVLTAGGAIALSGGAKVTSSQPGRAMAGPSRSPPKGL